VRTLALLLVPALAAADPAPGRVYVAGAGIVGTVGQHGGYGYDVSAAGRVGGPSSSTREEV
jgi:hypothetical protein